MEFKGTKGTWEYNGGNNYSIDIILPNDSEISLSRYNRYSDRLSMDRDEMQANALLVSKAPEMLEMLIHVKDYLGSDQREKVEELIKSATTI